MRKREKRRRRGKKMFFHNLCLGVGNSTNIGLPQEIKEAVGKIAGKEMSLRKALKIIKSAAKKISGKINYKIVAKGDSIFLEMKAVKGCSRIIFFRLVRFFIGGRKLE